MSGPVWGVVLAAGASVRMGRPKALATLDGEPFVLRAVRALSEGGCARVLVVVAEPHGAAIEAALAGAEVVWNAEPERGQLGSLKRALALCGGARAVAVALVDHPRVRPSTVAALLAAQASTGAALVRPRRDGKHGHPYVVGPAAVAALRSASEEGGARRILSAFEGVSVDVEDPGIHDDVDTPAEARRIGAKAEPPDGSGGRVL